ncbi:hypothetical protein ACM66B_006020 [Microbotryomycetes sp. NB124-2]
MDDDGPRKRARVEQTTDGHLQANGATANGATTSNALQKVPDHTPGALVCHQDRQPYDQRNSPSFIKCTHDKTGPEGPLEKCGNLYCKPCLESHYNVDFEAMSKLSVRWACPQCMGVCTCAACRQRSRLKLLAPKIAANTSTAIDLTGDSDSSLSAVSDSDDEVVSHALGASMSRHQQQSEQAGQKQTQPPTRNSPPTNKIVRVGRTAKANGQAVAAVAAKTSDGGPVSAAMTKTNSKGSTRGRQTRPPPKADPPPCYALSRVFTTPSTINIKARLHIRSFIFRFIEQIETLHGSGQKLRMTMNGLADDPIWFFSQNAELGHRHILRGLLELLEGEEQADIMAEKRSWKLMERLIREEADNAISSTQRDVINQPWHTLKEILEAESTWDEHWDKLVVAWERERQKSVSPDRDTRHRAGELSPDAKLALLTRLIELIYNAESVRLELGEGIEHEKTKVIEINKRKTEIRKEWEQDKKTIMSESGPKPKAHKLLREWQKKFPDIDEKLQEAEDKAEKRMLEAQRDIWICRSETALRFAPCGIDVDDNQYYILNRTDRSPFPGTKNVREHDDYPLSWAIIVHGTPFDFGKDEQEQVANGAKTSAAKPVAVVKKAREDSMDVDDDDEEEEDDAPVGREFGFTHPEVAEAYEERAREHDAWFLVDPLENGDDLADWIEYQAKTLDYRDWKREQEQTAEGVAIKQQAKPMTKSRGEPAEKQWRDVSGLVDAIRSFVDYVQCESDMAEEVKAKKATSKKKRPRWS